jgi:hypothetical protein
MCSVTGCNTQVKPMDKELFHYDFFSEIVEGIMHISLSQHLHTDVLFPGRFG